MLSTLDHYLYVKTALLDILGLDKGGIVLLYGDINFIIVFLVLNYSINMGIRKIYSPTNFQSATYLTKFSHLQFVFIVDLSSKFHK